MSRAETCVRFRPGTERSSSAKFLAGASSICCAVMTLIVAGALISRSSVREEVTTTVSSRT
jgi:hypothetical protein